MQPDHKFRRRRTIRPALLDIIAHAVTDAGSDDVDILRCSAPWSPRLKRPLTGY
jgi:hypothetical protein